MSSVSRILFVSAMFCAQSVVACGGSADFHDNAASAGNAGAGNVNSAGTSSHSAGASTHEAPQDGGSAGVGEQNTGGTVVQSGGAPNSGSNGALLSQVKTDAQALAVCKRIKDSISDADLKKMVLGSCAITGQTGAASQQGTCEELQAECAKQTPLPSTDDCTAEDIPDCDNVTVDEYVACTRSMMAGGIEFLSEITCETDLQSLQPPETPSACRAPFARCPEYAASFQ